MIRLAVFALAITSIPLAQSSILDDPLSLISNVVGLGQFAQEVLKSLFEEQDRTLEDVSKKIDVMNGKVNKNMVNIISKLEDIPSIIDLLDDRKSLKKHTSRTGRIFKELSLTKKRIDLGEFNNEESDHKQIWTLYEHDLKEDLDGVRRIMLDSNITSYLTADFQTKLEKYENVCNTKMSHLQLLDNLLSSLRTTTVQYYISRRMIYEFLEFEKKENHSKDKKFLDEDVLRDYKDDITKFKGIMVSASRDFWICDPVDLKDRKRDSTDPESPFQELQLFTKYLVLSDSLPEEYLKCPETKCNRKTMNFFEYNSCVMRECPNKTEVKKCSNLDKLCSGTRSCPRELRDCTRMHPIPQNYPFISDETKVCADKDTKAFARYKSIFSQDRAEDFRCPDGNTHGVTTWTTTTDFSSEEHISYECNCAENDYYLSRSKEITTEGYVLTGAQLVMHERTIYIQIQEGKLLPNGLIDKTSIRWVPINNYVTEDSERIKISVNEHKSIDLTEATLPEDRVITGLGFSLRNNHRVYLDVLSTQFEFESGNLIYRPSFFRSERSDLGSDEFDLTNSDVSIRGEDPNVPSSKKNDYVTFTSTSLEKDGGQSIVPFIDTQKVESNSPSPLSAASLYIRGQKGYGGFLGLKFKTYNFVPHIKVDSELSLDFEVKA